MKVLAALSTLAPLPMRTSPALLRILLSLSNPRVVLQLAVSAGLLCFWSSCSSSCDDFPKHSLCS